MEPTNQTNVLSKSRDSFGNLVINQYTILQKLGTGAYASVKRCQSNQGTFVTTNQAVKIFKIDYLRRKRDFSTSTDGNMVVSSALDDVQRQISIMKELNHPNILKIHQILHDHQQNKRYLVVDYCAKGCLLEWDTQRFFAPWNKKPMSENQIRHVFRSLVKAIHYLHNMNIVHRDIKPQNVLLTANNTVKLADFGQACLLQSESASKNLGTYQFLSPESLQNRSVGKSSDIWALGVTLYGCVYSCLPFNGENLAELIHSIENEEIRLPKHRSSSKYLRVLLSRMLQKDSTQRISLNQIIMDKWVNNKNPSLINLL